MVRLGQLLGDQSPPEASRRHHFAARQSRQAVRVVLLGMQQFILVARQARRDLHIGRGGDEGRDFPLLKQTPVGFHETRDRVQIIPGVDGRTDHDQVVSLNLRVAADLGQIGPQSIRDRRRHFVRGPVFAAIDDQAFGHCAVLLRFRVPPCWSGSSPPNDASPRARRRST